MPDGVEGSSDGREVVDVVDQKGRTRLYASLARFLQSIFCPYQATPPVLPPDHAVGSAIIRPACNWGFVAPSLVPIRPSIPGVRCIPPWPWPPVSPGPRRCLISAQAAPALATHASHPETVAAGRVVARRAGQKARRAPVAHMLAIIRGGRRRPLFVPAQPTHARSRTPLAARAP